MRAAILRSGIFLAIVALGVSAATAQTELYFATGVDSTGWAQAQSNADGHVLIESPQYPRGLWLHLVDTSGEALAGLQVEYQGRPDSLVAIRCVDPTGGVRETLFWSRPEGDPVRVTLKPRETAELPVGLNLIDWQIDPSTEFLLEPVKETRLSGWEAVAAFLWDRWQSQAGRVAVQLDAITLAIELDHPEAVEMLVAHLQKAQQPAEAVLGAINPLEMQVFAGNLGLREGVILFHTSLFDDPNLEAAVRQALDRPQGHLTLEDVASLIEFSAKAKGIRSLGGIEYFTALRGLHLDSNAIVDVTPLAPLTSLDSLSMNSNQIADLTPLTSLTNLTSLRLCFNLQIADLTPLTSLTNLTELFLCYNRIVDLTPLGALTRLEVLLLNFQISNQLATPLPSSDNLRESYI